MMAVQGFSEPAYYITGVRRIDITSRGNQVFISVAIEEKGSRMRRLHRCLMVVIGLFFLINCTGNKQPDRQAGTPLSEEQREQAIQLVTDAERAFEEGSYNEALRLLDSAAAYNPRSADIAFHKGQILENMNRLPEAAEFYRETLSLDSTYPWAHYNQGNIAFRQGRFREALQQFTQELRVEPRPDVWLNIGLVYANLHKPDSARWAYRNAIQVDSSFAPAYMLLGQEYKNDGQLQEALKYSRQGVQLDADNPTYLGIVGAMLFQMGELKEALPYLEKALAERSWDYRSHFTLGRLLEQTGQLDRSQRHLAIADSLRTMLSYISRLERQVQEQPDQTHYWVQLAEMYRQLGRPEEARQMLQVAANLAPGMWDLQNNVAYLSLTLGDTADALNRFKRILAEDSTLTDVWFNLGVVLTELGRTTEAIEAWNKVLESTPEDTAAQNYLNGLTASK